MQTDQSMVIRDYVLSKPILKLSLYQQPNSMCFQTCILSLFGIKSLTLNQESSRQFNKCNFTFEMDECPGTAESDLRAVAMCIEMHFDEDKLGHALLTDVSEVEPKIVQPAF
jgi:hypothetical protein